MIKINDDQIVGGQLRKIGNALSLRPEIDKDLRVTGLIRSNLSVVDIIPVDYALNFTYLWDKDSPQFAISYDFTRPTEDYRKRCKRYELTPYDGVQLWLTDDTQASEEVTHTFENNLIEAGIDKLLQNQYGQLGRRVGQTMASAGWGGTLNSRPLNTGAMDKLKEMTNNSDFAKGADNVLGTLADVVIRGKQISMPKIWKQSDYNPSLMLNVKLVSPYGSPKAIKEFIIAPIVYLLLMSTPESGDGLSYGLYQPVKIKAYGISNINLGAITAISIRRGGRETAYNAYKQPLQVDVSLQVMPLTSGFAFMTENIADVATMKDADIPYSENATGSPAITTVGNMIQSFRPAPYNVIASAINNSTTGAVVAGADNAFTDNNANSNGAVEDAFGKFAQAFGMKTQGFSILEN